MPCFQHINMCCKVAKSGQSMFCATSKASSILSYYQFSISIPQPLKSLPPQKKNHVRFSREKGFGFNHNTESYSDHYCLPCELQGRPLYQRKYELTSLKIEQMGKNLIFDGRIIRKTGNASRK